MRNPNGYGSVVKLSGKRRNPYMVRKTSGFNEKKQPVYNIIGYAPTREAANIMLAKYNENPWSTNVDKITFEEMYQEWKKSIRYEKLGNSNKKRLNAAFKGQWDELMEEIGCTGMTSHCCRHTFRTALYNSNADQLCIDRIMGHVSPGVGQAVYTHISIDQPDKTRFASFAGSRAAANGNASISACLVPSRKLKRAVELVTY